MNYEARTERQETIGGGEFFFQALDAAKQWLAEPLVDDKGNIWARSPRTALVYDLREVPEGHVAVGEMVARLDMAGGVLTTWERPSTLGTIPAI